MQRIRSVTIMRYINSLLLTYLLTFVSWFHCRFLFWSTVRSTAD